VLSQYSRRTIRFSTGTVRRTVRPHSRFRASDGTGSPFHISCQTANRLLQFARGRRSRSGKHSPPVISQLMPTDLFKASRWTRGNFIFPTIIEVSDKAVTRRKRSWISRDEISVSISKVASVHVTTGMVWSDILIESSGGSDPLASHGHTKGDAV